jgi:hypothetical protein
MLLDCVDRWMMCECNTVNKHLLLEGTYIEQTIQSDSLGPFPEFPLCRIDHSPVRH